MVAATGRGYDDAVADPEAALDDLLAAVPELDPAEQRAQLEALLAARALGPGVELDRAALAAWAAVGGRARDRRAAARRRARASTWTTRA